MKRLDLGAAPATTGGLVSILYGAALRGVAAAEFSLVVAGSAMEEDCDGIAYKTILDEDRLRPSWS